MSFLTGYKKTILPSSLLLKDQLLDEGGISINWKYHNHIFSEMNNYIILDGLEGDTRIYC